MTWHQLSANQQPTGLAWQPIKDPHSHAEQRHITMETLTHTLTHSHTHTQLSLSLSVFHSFSSLLIPSSIFHTYALQCHSLVTVSVWFFFGFVPLFDAVKNHLTNAQRAPSQLCWRSRYFFALNYDNPRRILYFLTESMCLCVCVCVRRRHEKVFLSGRQHRIPKPSTILLASTSPPSLSPPPFLLQPPTLQFKQNPQDKELPPTEQYQQVLLFNTSPFP